MPGAACPQPIALAIWNACGGIDWQALDVMVELHGVSDVETLIDCLFAIRDFLESTHD